MSRSQLEAEGDQIGQQYSSRKFALVQLQIYVEGYERQCDAREVRAGDGDLPMREARLPVTASRQTILIE